jgi:hypothetical protein
MPFIPIAKLAKLVILAAGICSQAALKWTTYRSGVRVPHGPTSFLNSLYSAHGCALSEFRRSWCSKDCIL